MRTAQECRPYTGRSCYPASLPFLPSLHGPFMLPGVPAATKNERQKAIVRYEKYQIRCNLYKNQEKVSLR